MEHSYDFLIMSMLIVFKYFVKCESVWDLLYYHTTEIVNFYLDVKFQCNSLEDTDIRCDGAFNSSVKSYASSRRWQCNSLLTRGLYRVKIKLKFVCLKSVHHHPLGFVYFSQICCIFYMVNKKVWPFGAWCEQHLV